MTRAAAAATGSTSSKKQIADDAPKKAKEKKLQAADLAVAEPSGNMQKRGRKPKAVYSPFEPGCDAQHCSTNSDDENVILHLSISVAPSDVEQEPITEPNAYNDDKLSDLCEISAVDAEGLKGAALATADPLAAASEPQDADAAAAKPAHRKVIKLLKDFEEKNKNNEWPMSTSICCYWCCHRFDGPPVGIPVKFVEGKFHVCGCFCSLECAAAHNFAANESHDEIWERNYLLNMLSRRMGGATLVKPAPPRLALKMFGGYMDIEEFRAFTRSGKLVNINFPPMMTVTQQLEEVNESSLHSGYNRFIPIDTDRVNKAKEKMLLKRTKPVNNFKNTLDHTMNIKISTASAAP